MKILRREYKFSEIAIISKSILKILLSPKKAFNVLLVKISVFFKLDKCLGLPLHLNIEPTGNCNYQCVKCERFSENYRDDGIVFDSKNMPLKYYEKIIDDIGETLLTLRLWDYGEPLLNNNIFHMVKYAKNKKIFVAISSNLSLLNEKKAKELILSGLDYLVVSFDGASKETYNLYHGKDFFNTVIKNIKLLVKAREELGYKTPLIDLQFIVMKENEKEIHDFKNLAKDLKVDKASCLRLHKDRINFKKFKHVKSEADVLPKNKDFVLNKDDIRNLSSCNMPWELALIRYSGLVLPCVSDLGQEWKMGNLFKNSRYLSFKNIWNNTNYQTFRKKVRRNITDVKICFDCAQRNNNCKDQISV